MSMHEYLVLGTLNILFERAEATTDLKVLADELGVSPERVELAVEHLAERGLVRQDTFRLTFGGLAAASALRSMRQTQTRAA